MKDRIRKFMEYSGISPVELADLLGVQRSNISHILNGRNKPGALFLEKFLRTFPRADARWLLTGEGEMIAGGGVGNGTIHLNSGQSGGELAIKAGMAGSGSGDSLPKPVGNQGASNRVHREDQGFQREFSYDSWGHDRPQQEPESRQAKPDGAQPETERSQPGQERIHDEPGYRQPGSGRAGNANQLRQPEAEDHPDVSGDYPGNQKNGQPAGGQGQMKAASIRVPSGPEWKGASREQPEVRSEPDVAYGKKPSQVPFEIKKSGSQIEKVILLRADGTFQSYDPG